MLKSHKGVHGILSELRLILRRGRQVWGLVPASQKFALITAALVMACTSACNTIMPLLVGYLVDGVTAGAKVQAMTVLDLVMRPELVKEAWDYFNNVQTKTTKYVPLMRPEDKPAIWLNQKTMELYRPQMKTLYYDPSKYDTYLDQLGIKYGEWK